MQHEIQYMQFRAHFPNAADGETVSVTLDDLASLWFCTPRNVKFIIGKMVSGGWIDWLPGRGRGNSSSVVLRASRENLLLQLTKELVHKGQLNEALETISSYGQGTGVRQRFQEWLTDYFGYKQEKTGGSCTETLRFPSFYAISTLDPANVFFAFDGHLVRQIFNTLVVFDTEKHTIEPQLAHYWESGAEGKVWRFYLRRGILFHHGRELSAEDVVYSFERLSGEQPNPFQGWFSKHIRSIRALNEQTVEFQLNTSNYLLPRFLCCSGLSIVPADVVQEKGEEFGRQPVGTGPFRLHTLNRDLCVLEANPSYFEGRPHIDRVEIPIVLKEFHLWEIPGKSGDMVRSNHGGSVPDCTIAGWNRIRIMCDGSSLLTFNMNNDGPQRHPNFRKAMNCLIDRGAMIRELGEFRRFPATGFHPGDTLVSPPDGDGLDSAKRLLAEMGYNGETFGIITYGKHEKDASWIQERCRLAGIRMEVSLLSLEEAVQRERFHEADGVLYAMVRAEGEISIIELFQSEQSYIRRHIDDRLRERVDERIRYLISLPSETERNAVLKEVCGLLVEDTSLLFLLFSDLNTSFDSRVKGVRFNPYGWADFKDIWLLPETAEQAG